MAMLDEANGIVTKLLKEYLGLLNYLTSFYTLYKDDTGVRSART